MEGQVKNGSLNTRGGAHPSHPYQGHSTPGKILIKRKLPELPTTGPGNGSEKTSLGLDHKDKD